jgi:putative transferase (TIGR04331 family)
MRAYPTGYPRTLQAWDFKFRLRDQLTRVRRVDETEGRARRLMYAARLVVVDYFSTAFLETLLADIPTIFLWNTNTRYVADAHRDFFDALIEAGVCQTDPVQAAAFVERVKVDPDAWWQRDEVRRAVHGFLAANMGPPAALIDCLLRLAADNDPWPKVAVA